MLFVATLVARFSLGLFLAGVLGFFFYLLGTLIALSFGVPGPGGVLATSLTSWAVGGASGGFLGWMSPNGKWRDNLVICGLALAGALAGAAIGLQIGYERETTLEAALSVTGIPQLAGIIQGSAIGANVPPLLHMLYLRLSGTRFTR